MRRCAIVALLLDDAMPPDGSANCSARGAQAPGLEAQARRRARRDEDVAAARVRARHQDVPADICAQLAECYGDDLAAHVPMRVPPQINR